MNHLIFGGSGFIGTHLKKYILSLQNQDDAVFSYDIKHKVSTDFEYLDVRKPIEIALNNINDSIIYNLAAIHTTPGHADEEYYEANILGAEQICDFARKNKINTIVFTSSVAAYGTGERFKSEDLLPMPNVPYGISKLTAEYIQKLWQAEDPINRRLFIVRPGVVFGEGEGGNYTRLYKSIKKGFFFYPGRTDTIKASVYVKDVARILYQGAQPDGNNVQTFNLSIEPIPTIKEICETMAEATNLKKPTLRVPSWFLKTAATTAYYGARLVGKDINGIHPDRVDKLIISTNISGKKLDSSPFKLKFTLKEALQDWYLDTGKTGLE
ncbi:nucleoside-diphosphate-sugar epimerase [Pedobacter sp. AK013]|uniref:NAD-dependent epimerase/dehydratase family protein n=1 Tax=Pedobacter sp. AK013 TaxID=2723071 RepID=UPI00161F1BCC|nr:NAD(P)-dependent oxidoreductase [Pedobacter sp. AK013]MBB6240086.1 nucleoside-diphosphate-sugar epimerase [Pedobacter sp. AK013]